MIPLQDTDLENIYLRSLGEGMRSLAVTSARRGEGVSSLAVALAQRHLLANRSVLLVDLNDENPRHQPLGQHDDVIETRANVEPQIVTDGNSSYALLGIPAPANNNVNREWRNPGVLEKHIAGWLKQIDCIIIDAGSFDRSSRTLVPVERIVGACDATLLVVMAGVTSELEVRQSCARIDAAGGKLAGSVLNNRVNPSLQTELLRETRRLPDRLAGTAQKISGWIGNNRLLSLEL